YAGLDQSVAASVFKCAAYSTCRLHWEFLGRGLCSLLYGDPSRASDQVCLARWDWTESSRQLGMGAGEVACTGRGRDEIDRNAHVHQANTRATVRPQEGERRHGAGVCDPL